MIIPEWQGLKLLGNGVVIAEVKSHLEGTFKVMYASKPDLGPNQLGYMSAHLAVIACEEQFGIALS